MAGERKFVRDNVKRALLKEYLKEQVKRAGFGGVDIQRTPMGTRVTLVTERPGLVIGRKGSSIKALTDAIEFEFGFDKPQVEVVEVDNPNLSAQIMAEKLASALERGWHFRRAGHSTVRRIMDAGARGCQVIISGKLTGQRHRTEKFKEGHIKFCGEPKLQWMEEGYTPAKLKPGIIGVKVQIMHPDAKLPDEVTITLEEHLKMAEKPIAVPNGAETSGAEPERAGGGPDEKEKEPEDGPGPEEKKEPRKQKKGKDERPKKGDEPEGMPKPKEKPAPEPRPKEDAKPDEKVKDDAPKAKEEKMPVPKAEAKTEPRKDSDSKTGKETGTDKEEKVKQEETKDGASETE